MLPEGIVETVLNFFVLLQQPYHAQNVSIDFQ